jgi:hypothetical protein
MVPADSLGPRFPKAERAAGADLRRVEVGSSHRFASNKASTAPFRHLSCSALTGIVTLLLLPGGWPASIRGAVAWDLWCWRSR